MRWKDPARLMASAQILKDRLLPDCAEHKTFRGPRAHGLGVHLPGAFYDRTTYRLCPQGFAAKKNLLDFRLRAQLRDPAVACPAVVCVWT